ncbi:MAG: type II secretion system protein [Deltaproteobacteria bacterium]|nr:type II secretion system protein [Deltaproteobacteria bacterium]
MARRVFLASGSFSRDKSGFTYISLLFLIVVIGIALSVTGEVWSTTAKRELEEELLFRGGEIKRAITRYYEEGPGGVKQFPRELKDLLKDPRQQAVKRYLRKLYADPMTGKSDWQLIKEKDGTIIGVKSRSGASSLKSANFPLTLRNLEGKTKYSEWEFAYGMEKKAKGPAKSS